MAPKNLILLAVCVAKFIGLPSHVLPVKGQSLLTILQWKSLMASKIFIEIYQGSYYDICNTSDMWISKNTWNDRIWNIFYFGDWTVVTHFYVRCKTILVTITMHTKSEEGNHSLAQAIQIHITMHNLLVEFDYNINGIQELQYQQCEHCYGNSIHNSMCDCDLIQLWWQFYSMSLYQEFTPLWECGRIILCKYLNLTQLLCCSSIILRILTLISWIKKDSTQRFLTTMSVVVTSLLSFIEYYKVYQVFSLIFLVILSIWGWRRLLDLPKYILIPIVSFWLIVWTTQRSNEQSSTILMASTLLWLIL